MDLHDLNRHAAQQDKADTYLIANLLRDRLIVAHDDPELLGRLGKYLPKGPMLMAAKAAVAPGSTTDATWAGPLAVAGSEARAFLDIAERSAVLPRLGAIRIDGQAVGSVLVGAPTATWLGEGAPKPIRGLSFTATNLKPRTLNVTAVVTSELARLGVPGSLGIVQRALSAGLTAGLDAALLDPASGEIANVRPASLTNGVSPTTAGSDLQSSVGAALNAISGGAAARPVVVVSAAVAARLTGLRDLSEAGVRVLVSPAAGSRVIAIDSDGILFTDGGVELSMSAHASVTMDDNPPGTDATTTIFASTFQRDLVALKVVRHVSWLKRADAVSYVTLV